MEALLLAFVLAIGQAGAKTLVPMEQPTYVMECHKWSLIVEAVSKLGYNRFMAVYKNRMSPAAQQFVRVAYEFVEEKKLQDTPGEVAYITAMIDCQGYRIL